MKPLRTNAFISLYGLILFVTIVIFLHFLRPDKNMLSSFVSEYAVGKDSWLMTIAFYALSIASTLLLMGFMQHVSASLTGKITLGIFCAGIFLAALFPTDVPAFPQTTVGMIHGFAALIALFNLSISMIAWGISFQKNNEFKKIAKPSVVWGGISFILLVIFIASPISVRGLTQRILLTWNISWLFLVNFHLYRTTKRITIATS
jgi:Protein of unknown function (DUF998)